MRVGSRHHHRLADFRQVCQAGLDLAEFDAMPADLDLEVETSQKLEVPVRCTANQVPRSVDPPPTRGVKRILHKALRSELGTVQIAAHHTVAADKELARNAHGDGLLSAVQNVELGIRERSADRDALHAGFDGLGRRPDRRLRGSVHVDDARRGHLA